MKDNNVWEHVELPSGMKPIGLNEYLKQKRIHKAKLKDIKLDLLQRVLLKRKTLITKRLSLQFH